MSNGFNCPNCKFWYMGVFEPRNGCQRCWGFYFKQHPGFVSAAESTIRVFGTKVLISSRGRKWAAHFLAFLEDHK